MLTGCLLNISPTHPALLLAVYRWLWGKKTPSLAWPSFRLSALASANRNLSSKWNLLTSSNSYPEAACHTSIFLYINKLPSSSSSVCLYRPNVILLGSVLQVFLNSSLTCGRGILPFPQPQPWKAVWLILPRLVHGLTYIIIIRSKLSERSSDGFLLQAQSL